jgi:hypothetical protein
VLGSNRTGIGFVAIALIVYQDLGSSQTFCVDAVRILLIYNMRNLRRPLKKAAEKMGLSSSSVKKATAIFGSLQMGNFISDENLFTATEIARTIGCTKQNVHKQLDSIPADGEKLMAGNRTKAWHIESLPQPFIARLENLRARKGNATIEDLLQTPFTRFALRLPLTQVRRSVLETARKRQRAFRDIILLRKEKAITKADLAERGLGAYKREFGYEIKRKYWWALLNQIVDHDGGAEESHRLDIYFDTDNPPRISKALPIATARERGLELLEDALASINGSTEPTVQQIAYVWTKACDELQAQIAQGVRVKRAKRTILDVLRASGYFGSNLETIRRNFHRKLGAYLRSGGKALADRRTLRPKEKISDDDKRVIAAAALERDGRLEEAWEAVRADGELSPELESRYATNVRVMPKRISREVRPLVNALLPLHKGERAFQQSGPYIQRDYSQLYSGQIFEMDDFTPEHICWVEDENPPGYRIIQGQVIAVIDVRSARALGFGFVEGQYHGRVIRSTLVRACEAFGIPDTVNFERGLWERAKILVGNKNTIRGHDEFEMGLREFMHVSHARGPQSKVIERFFLHLARQMTPVVGWCGRDMRRTMPERLNEQKKLADTGKLRPSNFCFSKAQMIDAIEKAMSEYNAKAQQGRLAGRTPNEVWDDYQAPGGRSVLGPKSHYLMAYHRESMKIRRRAITKKFGRETCLYYNEYTAAWDTRTVLVWYHPDDLSRIHFTSLDRKEGPFLVPLAEKAPAGQPQSPSIGRIRGRIDACNKVIQTEYRLIQPFLAKNRLRPTYILDPRTVEAGEKIAANVVAHERKQRRSSATLQKIHALQRELNMSLPIENDPKRLAAVAEAGDLIKQSRLKRAEQLGRAS